MIGRTCGGGHPSWTSQLVRTTDASRFGLFAAKIWATAPPLSFPTKSTFSIPSASMTSAIDRLEKRGLVRRKTCDSDRRIRFVELTDCGKAFIEEIYARHEKDLEAVIGGLGDEERRVIYEGLKKIGLAAKVAVPTQKLETEATQDPSA